MAISSASVRVAPVLTRHFQPPPPSSARFARPRLVISPEPHGGELVRIADGRQLLLRPIEASDVAAVQRCFKRLSPEDVRRRFMHAMSELPTPMAQRLCRVDPELEAAWVLMDQRAQPAELRGVGRIYVDRSANSAEFSVLVESQWSRLGLGALLLRRLVDESRRRGLDEIWGYVLMENRPMLELARELGFSIKMMPGDAVTAQITLAL